MVKLFKKKKNLDVPVPPSRAHENELPEIKKKVMELSPRPKLPLNRFEGPLPPPPAPPSQEFPMPVKPVRHKEPMKEPLRDLESRAPLFIKIDKYREIVKDIQRMKSYSLSLRDALDALSDIEKELRTGLSLTTKALDRFNSIISVLDSKFLRFQSIGPEERQKMAKSSEEIDDYVKDLYNQMEKIRHELSTISS